MSTSTLIDEITLGPLDATQRSEIMRHATELGPEGRRVFRRLLIPNGDPQGVTRTSANPR